MARFRRMNVVTDKALLKQAERVLATVRRISQSLAADQLDPERRRKTRRMLRWAHRQFAAYRKDLEALRDHPYAGPALEKQIHMFMLIEDECRPVVEPFARRQAAEMLVREHGFSIGRACRVTRLSRTAWYRRPRSRMERDRPVIEMLNELVARRPRWGFWKLHDRLRLDVRWLMPRPKCSRSRPTTAAAAPAAFRLVHPRIK